MTQVAFPDAPARIQAAIDAGILKAGSWGDGNDAVCMMSAIVKGAYSTDDCVSAGWPEWLASLNVSLFDADVGAADEDKARAQFALDLSMAASQSFDHEAARARFLISRLDTGEHSALKSLRLNPVDADWWRNCQEAIATVVQLLRRKLAGEDVTGEMAAARAAADAAAHAAADAAYAAASPAARVAAHSAARVATLVAADAADAADAAAYAADAAYAAYAAVRAAYAAARADLISAIEQ